MIYLLPSIKSGKEAGPDNIPAEALKSSKEVKRSIRADNQKYAEDLATTAEIATR